MEDILARCEYGLIGFLAGFGKMAGLKRHKDLLSAMQARDMAHMPLFGELTRDERMISL